MVARWSVVLSVVQSINPLQFLLLVFAGWVSRNQQEVIDYLQEENKILREKLGGKRIRFTDAERRRLARRAKRLSRKSLRQIDTIVTPDTLIRWYRTLVAKKYDGSRKRGQGRPRKPELIERLIVRMAEENPRWGYTRIQGAMRNLKHSVGRTTIKRILSGNGLEPATGRKMPWKTFLRAHWGAIAATDFFTVEVLTWGGLVRYFVLFVIDLETRRLEIAGITPQPNEAWMEQVARNLTDVESGFLCESRFLIHDRDPLFSSRFAATLRDGGVETVKLPTKSPNLNAFAERFVRSIKSECLAEIIPLGERHLRTAVSEYVEHYHRERNHQGLGNRLIEDPIELGDGEVGCRERLGGLLKFYFRAAA